MSTSLYPLAVWPENILQARLPANDNSLRLEAFGRGALSDSTTAQPGSPADGDVYIIPSTHTGAQWSAFTPGDVAIYRGGTWYAFAPTGSPIINVAGTLKQWTGAAWSALSGGGTPGGSTTQVQYNNAGAFAGTSSFTYASNTLSVPNITLTGLALTAASATGGAGLRLPHGAAPTSPTNGDVWTTTAGLYARINGTTVGPYGVGGGMTNPLTTTGDMIYSSSGTTPARLGIGSTGNVLTVVGGVPAWAAPTNFRSPSVQTVSSASTVTPTFSDDQVEVTALAANVTLANPTGTAIPALGISIRIKDNGTARTISYGTQYRAVGVTLPTTTVISKTLYLGMVYNAADTKWDVVAVAQEA